MNHKLLTVLFSIILCAVSITAQTTEFTYQGKLTDSGTATATYDFEFRMCDSLAADCTMPLAVQQIAGVSVSDGVFTVRLDFGAAVFDSANRWLEIAVKRPAQAAYTTLIPRQPLTSSPYAIRALNAVNAELFGGFNTDGFVLNTTQPQTGNFNLSGDGTLGGILFAGRVGIGALPQAGLNLDVTGNTVFRTANGNVNVGTPNGETGITFTGTNRADLRFNGSTLKLVTGTGTGVPSDANGIIINTAGKVGIGTTTTSAQLNVNASSFSFDDGISSVSPGGNGINAQGGSNGVRGFTDSPNSRGVRGISINGTGVEGSGTIFGVFSNGFLGTDSLGTAGGTQLCLNASNQVATCGSSFRYKKDFQSFSEGLDFINQLRPLSYRWKTDDIADIGFGAEDVARINPLFVTYNAKGEVEGIKYDRLSVVFVNAFKEQQVQIKNQQEQIERQQQQLDGLTRLVCSQNPNAEICKEK